MGVGPMKDLKGKIDGSTFLVYTMEMGDPDTLEVSDG